MRSLIACAGSIIVLATFQPLGAEDAPQRDTAAITQEIAEVKQTLEKLSAQLRSLERELDPRIAKTYRVTDLVTPEDGSRRAPRSPFADFDPLVRYITNHIAPQQWKGAGGQGTIDVYEQNLSIVVRQSEEVHAELAQWLEKIRAAKAVIKEYEQGQRATFVPTR